MAEGRAAVTKRREEKERQDVLTGILGKAVRSTNVRISVLFLYFCYLSVCFYGICNVVVYFDKTKLIMYDSTMKKFVDVEDRLFRDKSFSISVIIRGDVNYTDEATLERIETFLGRLEDSVYINEHLTKSWLKDFQTFTFLNSTDMVKQTEPENRNKIMIIQWPYLSERISKFQCIFNIQKWTRSCQNATLCTPNAHGAHLSELNNGVILPILLTLLFDIRTNVGCLGHHYILTICFC